MSQCSWTSCQPKITKLPSQHSMLGHHRPASETPFKWRFAGRPMMAYKLWYLDPLSPQLKRKLIKFGPPLTNFLDPHMKHESFKLTTNCVKQSSDVISVMFCCMNRKEEMLIFIRVIFKLKRYRHVSFYANENDGIFSQFWLGLLTYQQIC